MTYKSLADKLEDFSRKSLAEQKKLADRTMQTRREMGWKALSSTSELMPGALKKIFKWAEDMNAKYMDATWGLHYAEELKGAMKLRPDSQVLASVKKMLKQNDQSVLIEALDFARPPYPKTWLEFRYQDMTVGILAKEIMDGDRFMGLQLHMIYDYDYKNPNSLAFTDMAGGQIVAKKGVSTPNSDLLAPAFSKYASILNVTRNITSKFRDSIYGSSLSEVMTGDSNSRLEIMMSLSLLLLLNSRSKIVRIDDENRKRKKHGRDENAMREICFDTGRILEKSQAGMTEDDARNWQAESLVRGHFKIRKTGVFWWSPYIRSKKDGLSEAAAREEHLQEMRGATRSGSHGDLDIPGKEGFSGHHMH